MSIFYVHQGETYDEERAGGYVWAPQLNKKGGKNIGYTTMTEIRKGDFILHSVNGKIMAISVSECDCYEANKPHELSVANTTVDWANEGYRVDTCYYDFDNPLTINEYAEWFREHYASGSAFTINGKGKQQYMCNIANEHATFILNVAINRQHDTRVVNVLKKALSKISVF